MKKWMFLLLLVPGGCYYPGYTVRRVMPAEPPVSRDEVERLIAAGVSEPVVLEVVDQRGAFPLTPDDLVALKKAGTPDAVVQKMIASERKEPARIVTEENYVGPAVAYPYYYPYYDYPYYYPAVGFGWGWGWGWGYRGYWRGGVRVYR